MNSDWCHFRSDLCSWLTLEVCFNWTLQQSAMKCTPYCVLVYIWPSVNRQDVRINRIYDGVEAETRKSQASFQII